MHLQSGKNPSSVEISDVPSVKSAQVSMSSMKFSDRGKNKSNLVSNDNSAHKPKRIYRKTNLSSVIIDDQSL